MDPVRKPGRRAWVRVVYLALAAGAVGTGAHGQVIPTAGTAPAPTPAKTKGSETVATTTAPIKVVSHVRDDEIDHTLETLLPKYPGVHRVDADVQQGVVTLDGEVDDDDTRDQMTQEAKLVEGVHMVINRLKTDEEVMTAPELVMAKLKVIWEIGSQRWLIGLLALGILMASAMLARVFNAHSETLLAPFVPNVMLRAVFGSVIGTAIVLGGLMFGLSILNLTHAVLSILGLAGMVGLAIGFAFKDITENFIASILLGVRKPFRVGDFVTVAGQTGVVQSLNTRATVLVTLDGQHVRIPNNIIYKEILINATASTSVRSSFDLVVPYDASTAATTEALTAALREVDGVLDEPPTRVLVEALEAGGVRLRASVWMPVSGVDSQKVLSDAKLRAKVALQQAGVIVTTAPATDKAPAAQAVNGNGNGKAREAKPAPAAPNGQSQAEANLRNDARAAQDARSQPEDGHPTPTEHALHNLDRTREEDEGANLLVEAK